MTTHTPSFDAVMAHAYKAPLDDAGVPILPADWDDGDERGARPGNLTSGSVSRFDSRPPLPYN
jgi:hypothetical protein